MAALALAYVTAPATAADNMPLPWDGRGQGMTDPKQKYLTHILTMRNNTNDGKVSDYVSIKQNGRMPAYNKDQGVISIGVDANAMFKDQTDKRRSELVQFVEVNAEGTTFFRTSVMKKEAFRSHKYQIQMIFSETHVFEIRVDAAVDPPMLIYLNNGTWDAKWQIPFVPGTWYNFKLGISASTSGSGTKVDFYMSEDDAEPVLTRTDDTIIEFAKFEEFHIGLLIVTDDGKAPKMDPEQDILYYNGVSVEAGSPSPNDIPGTGKPEKVTVTKRQQGGSALAPISVMAELKGHGLVHFCEEMPASEVSEYMTWTCWFKMTRLYQVGIVYMCTRLIVNITQVFLSFYLIVTLEMSATSITIVPLLVYLSGFVAIFCLRRLNESMGRAGSFALGAGFIALLLTLS
ncbi:hypothetical protein PsorP6_017879 [Peronosclerospora sorghi]|uniref:Uncharacterized protein n=1 Tax=Peronosclerospora sorghi TaxID=230839 RepID=A0ACC0WEC7_9STRA|nr:hypothetical protein PsorP6_017879 [Peronosclerospora sorghi]